MRGRQVYLVTGNKNKLKELVEIFPADYNLQPIDLDIEEIQSLDSREIIKDKLRRAYTSVKQPVIAEDVSAELECLKGLPGPFVKYFEKRLGKGALWQLARGYEDKSITVRCTMGFYDGQDYELAEGVVRGRVVAPRGENGFGFDFVLVPEGEERTAAEMSLEEKNRISWRALAAKNLLIKLQQ